MARDLPWVVAMNHLRFVPVVLACVVIGCAGTTSPTSPSSLPASPSSANTAAVTSEQLAGSWTLVSVQSTGHADQAVPAGAPYSLTFANDRVSTRVDCNMCNGGYTMSGDTLTV